MSHRVISFLGKLAGTILAERLTFGRLGGMFQATSCQELLEIRGISQKMSIKTL
jgi:hypothetical protein